ncbi:MAG: hypothetical protein ACJ731_12880 [Vicinamibacterales bacterium]
MKRTIVWLVVVVTILVAGIAYAAMRRDRWYRNTAEGRRQALLEDLQPVALTTGEL